MTSVRFTFFHHPPHWDPCAASHLPVSLLPYGESSAQQPGLEVSGLSTILLVQLSSSTLSPFMASVACRVKIRACNSALRALCGCEPAHLSHLSPLMRPFLQELNHCTFSAPPWHVAVVHAVSCFSYNQCCYLHSSVLLSSTPPPVPGPYHVLFPLPGMLCIPHLAYDPPLSLLQGALPDSRLGQDPSDHRMLPCCLYHHCGSTCVRVRSSLLSASPMRTGPVTLVVASVGPTALQCVCHCSCLFFSVCQQRQKNHHKLCKGRGALSVSGGGMWIK